MYCLYISVAPILKYRFGMPVAQLLIINSSHFAFQDESDDFNCTNVRPYRSEINPRHHWFRAGGDEPYKALPNGSTEYEIRNTQISFSFGKKYIYKLSVFSHLRRSSFYTKIDIVAN